MTHSSADAVITCPECGSRDVAALQRMVLRERKRGAVSYSDEYSRCSKCGEEFYTYEQSLAGSRSHAAAVREAEQLISGEEIRAARIGLGLTQEDFEDALGVGRKTVVRWERGTVLPSSAANGLLWLAANHPAVFLEYAATRPGYKAASDGHERIVAAIAPSAHDQGGRVFKRRKGLQRPKKYKLTGRTSGRIGPKAALRSVGDI